MRLLLVIIAFWFSHYSILARDVKISFVDNLSQSPIVGVICVSEDQSSIISISNKDGVVLVSKSSKLRVYKSGYCDTIIYFKKNTQVKLTRQICSKRRSNELLKFLDLLNSTLNPVYYKRVFVFEIDNSLKDTTAISFFQTKFYLDKSKRQIDKKTSTIFNDIKVGRSYQISRISVDRFITKSYYESDQIMFDHHHVSLDTSLFSELFIDITLWDSIAIKSIVDSCNISYSHSFNVGDSSNGFLNKVDLNFSSHFFNKELVSCNEKLAFHFNSSSLNVKIDGDKNFSESHYICGFNLPVLIEAYIILRGQSSLYLIFEQTFLSSYSHNLLTNDSTIKQVSLNISEFKSLLLERHNVVQPPKQVKLFFE